MPGSVSVRDVVELRHLQATLLAGEAGLDRKVSWAHVSDAFDPWNWLEPGDLVADLRLHRPGGAVGAGAVRGEHGRGRVERHRDRRG